MLGTVQLEVIGFRVGAPLGAGCPCYAVSDHDTLILLDFGPGALERTWSNGLLGKLDAIVISHMHLDHATRSAGAVGRSDADRAERAVPR